MIHSVLSCDFLLRVLAMIFSGFMSYICPLGIMYGRFRSEIERGVLRRGWNPVKFFP